MASTKKKPHLGENKMNFNELVENQLNGDSEYNIQETENGALGYKRTKSKLLDFNYKISSYRNKSEQEIETDWLECLNENLELSTKFLFYIRDARQGLGERRLFRICLPHTLDYLRTYYLTSKEILDDKIPQLLLYVVEYGRGDDLVYLYWDDFKKQVPDGNFAAGNKTEYVPFFYKYVFTIISNQLENDILDATEGKPISLLAKGLPSVNTSSEDTKRCAKGLRSILCDYCNFVTNEQSYRKILSNLRKHIDVVERKTSSNRGSDIDYKGVPSKANLKYANAFLKHDEERRRDFLANNAKDLKSSVTFPHEILHGLINDKDEQTMELLWKNLPNLEIANTMVVADGSGSMTNTIEGSTVEMLTIANALAIYFSERNKGIYKNSYITFSMTPRFIKFGENNSLKMKGNIAKKHSEVSNTNIKAVFDLILDTAIKNKCKQEDLPENILIISDMEFDDAGGNRCDNILFKSINRRYTDNGYNMPRLIFWNLASRTGTIPMIENENGLILISGFSINTMKIALSGNLDPYKALVETLQSERYSQIKL